MLIASGGSSYGLVWEAECCCCSAIQNAIFGSKPTFLRVFVNRDLTVEKLFGVKLYTLSHFSQSNPLYIFKLYIAIKLTLRPLAT